MDQNRQSVWGFPLATAKGMIASPKTIVTVLGPILFNSDNHTRTPRIDVDFALSDSGANFRFCLLPTPELLGVGCTLGRVV